MVTYRVNVRRVMSAPPYPDLEVGELRVFGILAEVGSVTASAQMLGWRDRLFRKTRRARTDTGY
jgi:hypothetical protein